MGNGRQIFFAETCTTAAKMPSKPFSIELADAAAELLKGAAGWFLIGLGVGALLTGTGGAVQQAGTTDVIAPLLVIEVGVLLIVSGVVVNPRFRRWLDRQHGLSQFGRIRTVENRTRSATEEQPEACSCVVLVRGKGLCVDTDRNTLSPVFRCGRYPKTTISTVQTALLRSYRPTPTAAPTRAIPRCR
jgi:hypothetical protein